MAAGGGRTDRTPYIIYALAAVQAALGTYFGTRADQSAAIQAVGIKVTAIEAVMPVRREMRDAQYRDLLERVARLEQRR